MKTQKTQLPELCFPAIMDNTTVSSFAKCPRQAFWNHFLHLKPKHESIHLHAGKAYAELCEVFRVGYYTPTLEDGTPSPLYRNTVESLIPAVRAFWISYGWDEARENSPEWTATAKSAPRMLECFIAMLREYPPATDPIQPLMVDGKPAVEKSFTLELDFKHPDTGDPLLFHGRFDMLAEYMGQIFVFDDKTTSALGPRWNDQWDMRSQFTGYCLGATTFGVNVAGAIVRGHCILKGSFKFAQPITYRKQDQVDAWWNDLHALVHQMIEAYKRAKLIEERDGTLAARAAFNTLGTFNDGCNAFAGCPYKQLDQTPHPQRWLNDYKVSVWNPMDPNNEGAA